MELHGNFPKFKNSSFVQKTIHYRFVIKLVRFPAAADIYLSDNKSSTIIVTERIFGLNIRLNRLAEIIQRTKKRISDPFAGGRRQDTVLRVSMPDVRIALALVAIIAQHGQQRKYLDRMVSMLPGN